MASTKRAIHKLCNANSAQICIPLGPYPMCDAKMSALITLISSHNAFAYPIPPLVTLRNL